MPYHATSQHCGMVPAVKDANEMAPIRIALLGSGIFARDNHAPALRALENMYQVVAIFSRSMERAAALAATFPYPIAAYTDMPALLARDDVEAVNSILPIPLQPAAIEAALRAGKHVISEKPAAPDVATGRRLLEIAEQYRQKLGLIWMVAENFRYAEHYQTARATIQRGEIGKPVAVSWSHYVTMNEENKYYHTSWRKDNSFPGGFILDGGVHNIAALRTVMGDVDSVSAAVTQSRADLPPADTVASTLHFASGAIGTFGMTFVQGLPWESPMFVVGESGALRLTSNLDEHVLDISHAGYIRRETFAEDAVAAELADFAQAITNGASVRSAPSEALRDVAVIEAMFESAESGQFVAPATIS
jgi:predicted dehydrogenase